MGLRKTIYVPEETWDFIQKSAKEENRSVSNYLVNKVMQKTIYVPTQEIWDSVIKAAAEQSISSYLLGLHHMNLKARTETDWGANVSISPDLEKAKSEQVRRDLDKVTEEDIRKAVVIDRDLRNGKHPYSEPAITEVKKEDFVEMANGAKITFSDTVCRSYGTPKTDGGPPHEGHPEAPILPDVGSVIEESDPVEKVEAEIKKVVVKKDLPKEVIEKAVRDWRSGIKPDPKPGKKK